MTNESVFLDDSYKIERTISAGYFPMSPAANVRESIFSVVLSHILESNPNGTEVGELREALMESDEVQIPDETVQSVWDVFRSTYMTTGQNEGNQYIIPFHPTIPRCLQPHEARNWGLWYQMLLYDPQEETFNRDLHRRIRDRLVDVDPSNVFEALFVKAVEYIGYTEEPEEKQDIIPYVPACSSTFQRDIEAWLDEHRLTSSEWLQTLRDLFCFHAMMYFVQLSINLRFEFEFLESESDGPYMVEIKPVYFGLEGEKASQDREFRTAWEENGPRGIEGDVFDSWGRLGVMHLIEKAIEDTGDDSLPSVATPTEFLADDFTKARQICIQMIRNRLVENRRPESDSGFAAHAVAYSTAVRQHYQSLPSQRQTPSSLGIRVLRRLGDGNERVFLKQQRAIGTTFRLNRGSLRFFARLFEIQDNDRHFQRFVRYLRARGIYLDDQSIDLMLQMLDEMGMISQKSDSGDAIYVQSI